MSEEQDDEAHDKVEEGRGGVRNTLVTSIAANIFDTLKRNDHIAAILNGVLDPSRTDKVYFGGNEEKCRDQFSGGSPGQLDDDHQHHLEGLLAE